MSSELQIRNTAPCPICGKTLYEWGQVGTRYTTAFRPQDEGLLSRLIELGTPSVARLCKTCGNLQLFTE